MKNFLYFSMHIASLVVSLGATTGSVRLIFLTPLSSPVRYSKTLIKPPAAFSSPGWIITIQPLLKWPWTIFVTFFLDSFQQVHGCLALGSPELSKHSRGVSPGLNRGTESPALTCWHHSDWCSPGGCWPLLPQGHCGSCITPPSFLSSANMLRVHLPPFSRWLMKRINSPGPVSTSGVLQW